MGKLANFEGQNLPGTSGNIPSKFFHELSSYIGIGNWPYFCWDSFFDIWSGMISLSTCCDNEYKSQIYYFNFRATTATPTNSNSTRVTPLSMRRRSPSPVVTGNVSRARMRFESGGSVKNNKTSPSPVPSGFEPVSCQHQTKKMNY